MSKSKKPRRPFSPSIPSGLNPDRLAQRGLLQELKVKYRPGHSQLLFRHIEGVPNDKPWDKSCIWGEGRERYFPNTVETRTEVEDVLRSSLNDFAPRPVLDMQMQASQVVTAINQHRGQVAEDRARRSYLACFEDINLCFQCKLPLKVKQARLQDMPQCDKCDHSLMQHSKTSCTATDCECTQYQVVSLPSMKRKVRKNHRMHDLLEHLTGNTRTPIEFYQWQNKGHRYTTAEIRSHYRWYLDPDTGKAFYQYYDGTGRDIRYKRTPYKYATTHKKHGKVWKTGYTESFVEIIDGVEHPVVPESSYRVIQAKCTCPYAHEQWVKIKKV